MTHVRVGAVGYLNARPLVYGLDRQPRFNLRFDVPSECARLLHAGAIDIGLIPSIEYLRGGPYCIVPDLAIASRGVVASVALFTTKPIADVRSIAMDTSSRTSVALVRVLCNRRFGIQPTIESRGPDLDDMLAHCDAALIIGDNALFTDVQRPAPGTEHRTPGTEHRTPGTEHRTPGTEHRAPGTEHPAPSTQHPAPIPDRSVDKLDLGDEWTRMTGLPFVWAFWAGRPAALCPADVAALQRARDEGVERPDELAREYLADAPDRQQAGADYLRENIKYYLRGDEHAALEAFYRYAVEAGVVDEARSLAFYPQP
jgi:chorismate dehydratase